MGVVPWLGGRCGRRSGGWLRRSQECLHSLQKGPSRRRLGCGSTLTWLGPRGARRLAWPGLGWLRLGWLRLGWLRLGWLAVIPALRRLPILVGRGDLLVLGWPRVGG